MAIRHVNPYGKVEYLDRPLSDCACNGCSGARRRERRSEGRRSRGGGSTMYDRRARRDAEPSGASGHVDLPSGEGHGTQYYEDGYRLSRDTDGEGDSNEHWTNQNVPKGRRRRHSPPPDAQ